MNDNATTGPYKLSFDLGFPHDTHNITVSEPKAEESLGQSKLEGYPIASDVFTTLQKTVVPDSIPSGSETVLPYEVSKYKQTAMATGIMAQASIS